jgi:hypothetical protein
MPILEGFINRERMDRNGQKGGKGNGKKGGLGKINWAKENYKKRRKTELEENLLKNYRSEELEVSSLP